MRRTELAINTDPSSPQYPSGNVRDSDETQDGSALYTVLFEDIQHNMQYLADKVLNEAPDNTIDGELPVLPDSIHNYQLVDAFAALFGNVTKALYSDRLGRTILTSTKPTNFETPTGTFSEDLPIFERIIPFTNGFQPPLDGITYDLRFKRLVNNSIGFNVPIQIRDNVGRLIEVVNTNFQDVQTLSSADGRTYFITNQGLYLMDMGNNNNFTQLDSSLRYNRNVRGTTSFRIRPNSSTAFYNTVYLLFPDTKTIYQYDGTIERRVLNLTNVANENARDIGWSLDLGIIVVGYQSGLVQIYNESDFSLLEEFTNPDYVTGVSVIGDFIYIWSAFPTAGYPLRAYDINGNFVGDVSKPPEFTSFGNYKIFETPLGLYAFTTAFLVANILYAPRNFSFK